MSRSGGVRSRFTSRIAGIVLALSGPLVLSGCWVCSVEPLYEEHLSKPDPDLVLDQSLIGSWGKVDDDCLWILTITAKDQAYALNMAPAQGCKSDDKPSNYKGHVVKLDNHHFLDVSPGSGEICDLCLPLHTFFLVSQDNDGLALIPADPDWLTQALKRKQVNLAHLEQHSENDPVTLTGSPKELKEFVRKYADDKAAFKPDSDRVLKFKRR